VEVFIVNGDSRTHLVVIPSYNTGPKLLETVRAALISWTPVWVVIDGSHDGSAEALQRIEGKEPGLRVLTLRKNQGKGAAILHALLEARVLGFTHALTMDADGQHPAHLIPTFMAASQATPNAFILGLPVFDVGAPALRVRGRRISNWWADLETLWSGIGDSLFGFRVYPITDLLAIMEGRSSMRRFDFDPEAAVRLCWRGLQPINLPAPVRYFSPEEGGISHFRYLRDNMLLVRMHARLVLAAFLRLPALILRPPRSPQ
jgi:glycosyltransferase involved in cell wall biosynthesis